MAGTGSLRVLGTVRGLFPEVSKLNPDFVPGLPRLKVTLSVDLPGGTPHAESLLAALEADFPTLARHRCCGESSLRDSFFRRGRRASCGVESNDPGVDVAHLVEHLIIDLQHFIGRMRICSGVTCAYRAPRNMYDIFVECPEEKVGLLSASIASGIVSDLIEGRATDGSYRCLVEAARTARDRAGQPLGAWAREIESAWGSEALSDACDYLKLQGYLTEREASVNFSGTPILIYEPREP